MVDENDQTGKDDQPGEDERSLEKLASYDDQHLLELLGNELFGTGVGFGPADARRYRRLAQEWLDSHAEELRQKICGSTAVQAVTDEDSGAKLTDMAVVADAVLTMLGHPSASIVAVIATRRGLASFCEGASLT
jgi:hypothetical protein